MDLTHASFFSGVGGLDLGIERAGWRTVSFSEIDPYASAVLAERWPGVPNLGDITRLGDSVPVDEIGHERDETGTGYQPASRGQNDDWRDAILWTGGFPCQDLSLAGKRRGFDGSRSSLAFAFIALVAAHRPPVVLLENVPGLFSSNNGRDFQRLIDAFRELRYVGAYREFDAQFFDVPQRRRRVFILAFDSERFFDYSGPAKVLAVGTRCERHPAKGIGTGKKPAVRTGVGAGGDGEGGAVVGTSFDSGGVRATDGLAGRPYDRVEVVATLNSGGNDGGFRTEPGEHLVMVGTLRVGPQKPKDGGPGDTVPVIAFNPTAGTRSLDEGPLSPSLKVGSGAGIGWSPAISGRSADGDDDPLLPLGLDSHRYRCCGNGVVASVSEWIGGRLAAYLDR